jgi:hypothetical protein
MSSQTSDPLATLSDMLAGDMRRMRRVAQVFCASTHAMLANLDHAAALEDWVLVRLLADRIRIGCIVVHETEAAESVRCLCEAHSDRNYMKWVYINLYSRDRARITDLIGTLEAALSQWPLPPPRPTSLSVFLSRVGANSRGKRFLDT